MKRTRDLTLDSSADIGAASTASLTRRSSDSARGKRKRGAHEESPQNLQPPKGLPEYSESEDKTSATNYSLSQNSSAPFANARDFVIGSLHIADGTSDRSDEALRWLKECAMPGAEYDSADRDPPPRCHPGTRTTIIKDATEWLQDPQRAHRLLWLRGAAGVGKSAIIQTLAESLSGVASGCLGASLFFSRPNGRENPFCVFPTLAYQFAVRDPVYRAYITQLMLRNPESLKKAMGEQFRLLIVEPFVSKSIRSESVAWVVALDGLDECGSDPNGKRHSDRVQCDIVRLISNFVRQYPAAPLIWIIASRPETHLKAVFSEPDVVPSFWEQEVPVDSDEACQDVEKFLHLEFTQITQNYPDHIHESPWPTNIQFLEITRAALGLFIFAEVVIRFIDNPSVGNPISQLEHILIAISKSPPRSQENPLATLDALYLGILHRVPQEVLHVTKQLLGGLIFLETCRIRISDCDLRQMCNHLNITRDVAITALRNLHSVVYFPKVKDIAQTRPRFYHASFRDFLEDPSRSHEYFIDKQLVGDTIFQDVIRLAETRFSTRPVSLSPSWTDGGDVVPPRGFILDCLHGLFTGEISLDGVCVAFHGMTCFIPDAQLQLLLENLSVLKLRSSWKMFWLLSRMSEQEGKELERRGFFAWTTFDSIVADWGEGVCISISHTYAGSSFLHLHLDKTKPPIHLGGAGDVVDDLLRCMVIAPQTKVKVLGHRKSERCVVITKEDLRGIWAAGAPINQYIITGLSLLTTESDHY